MILINKFSLLLIAVSLLFLIVHPKIKLPFYIDAFAMFGALGALALLLNPTYYIEPHANTLFRAVICGLIVIAVTRQYLRSVRDVKKHRAFK